MERLKEIVQNREGDIRRLEAIHDARHVDREIEVLRKSHGRWASNVLKNLQSEERNVSDLEKALASEKQKVQCLEMLLDAGVQPNIEAKLGNVDKNFSAPTENQGKEPPEAIDGKQKVKMISPKNLVQASQTFSEHQTESTMLIGDQQGLVTTRSANRALKSKNADHESLRTADIDNTAKENARLTNLGKYQNNHLPTSTDP